MIALLMGLAAAPAGQQFDVARDAQAAVQCAFVYDATEHSSARLIDRDARTAGVVQGYRGAARIAPLIATARARLGDAAIDGAGAMTRMMLGQMIGGAQMDAESTDPHVIEARLFQQIASGCDRRLDLWGVPASPGLPDDVAKTGFAEFRVNDKRVGETFADLAVVRLSRAACDGDAPGVASAMAAGANPNAEGKRDLTPLGWAIACESLPGIAALLDARADPTSRWLRWAA